MGQDTGTIGTLRVCIFCTFCVEGRTSYFVMNGITVYAAVSRTLKRQGRASESSCLVEKWRKDGGDLTWRVMKLGDGDSVSAERAK